MTDKHNVSRAVLAGAVWGDHCSPISDTTILSSTGSGATVITHVTTHLPYAISAAVMAGGDPEGGAGRPRTQSVLGSPTHTEKRLARSSGGAGRSALTHGIPVP